MTDPVEIRMPSFPDCWDSCGACYGGSVAVSEVLVAPGDRVAVDDPVILLELDKSTLEIPTTRAGEVVEIRVQAGDEIREGTVLMTLQPAQARSA